MKKEYASEEAQPDEAAVSELAGERPLPAVRNGTALTLGEVEGDYDMSDLRLPRLEMAYGVGKYVGKQAPGTLVLGGDNVLATLGESVQFLVLNASVYWKEYLSKEQWAAKAVPKTFAKKSEVVANGGTVDWALDPKTGMNKGPTFSKAMDLKILVRKPEKLVCGLFGVNIDGAMWAPAIWSVDKSAYRRVAGSVLAAAKFALRGHGLLHGVFEVRTAIEQIGGNPTVVPIVKMVSTTSDAAKAALKELFEAPVDSASIEASADK